MEIKGGRCPGKVVSKEGWPEWPVRVSVGCGGGGGGGEGAPGKVVVVAGEGEMGGISGLRVSKDGEGGGGVGGGQRDREPAKVGSEPFT